MVPWRRGAPLPMPDSHTVAAQGGGWHPGMACLFGDGCFAIINKKHRFSRMSSLRQPTGLGSFTPGRKETNVSLTSPVACVDIIGSHGAGVPTRIRPEAADEIFCRCRANPKSRLCAFVGCGIEISPICRTTTSNGTNCAATRQVHQGLRN